MCACGSTPECTKGECGQLREPTGLDSCHTTSKLVPLGRLLKLSVPRFLKTEVELTAALGSCNQDSKM